jgi:hypothetical protein
MASETWIPLASAMMQLHARRNAMMDLIYVGAVTAKQVGVRWFVTQESVTKYAARIWPSPR